ncbi:MAG: phytoene/squalene synthase family protein [Chloroflexota bacterium]
MDVELKRAGSFLPVQPPAGIASAEDYAVCRRVMRAASKNYSFASNFFPSVKRPHVEALYAFLRVGDDRVDVSYEGFPSPVAAIEAWEQAYWQAFELSDSPHPVMRAYLDTAISCGIPRETMTTYFRAMKEDASLGPREVRRYPTFADLLKYMEGSAIPVGRAMLHILGVRAPYTLEQARPGADSLSIAMQLSNFWRDISADWRIRRSYIPQEDMDYFGYTEADLAAGRLTPGFVNLLEFEFQRTEGYYLQARESVKMLSSGRWAVLSGLEVYRAILSEIRRSGYDVFSRRAGASTLSKLGLAVRAYRRLKR